MSSAQKGRHRATFIQGMSLNERLLGGGRLSIMYFRSYRSPMWGARKHIKRNVGASERGQRTSAEMLG